ncbi:MAG: cofactor assembly of complex C subunit B [Synechococcaceae cyanobacterium RM1_1_27]|nr:cofactor assembly of complex C subunit B [Synechococcaceae cyanobacterium SM2_3_2]NJO85804.1 cofactor assembly of complex C subunit B [Synechococcaceae cyanobacterium RM1_1_27]
MSLQPVAISTLLMTTLLAIGLFFFIRASGKDRVETRLYKTQQSLETLGSLVRQYLLGRGFVLVSADESGIATFQGQAQPSGFLAVLLTLLATVGLACLAMVLQTLFPQGGRLAWLLLTAAPLAGDYYRFRNQRLETVRLRIEQSSPAEEVVNSAVMEPAADNGPSDIRAQLHISGHRDELDDLELNLGLAWAD